MTGAARFAKIDKLLERERLSRDPERRVPLLGTSESGKSTTLKAMKLFAKGDYSHEERSSFAKIIWSNVTHSTEIVLQAMVSWGYTMGCKE